MSLCFVIMPYGGTDPDRQKHFLGVYAGIIATAANRLGMEVRRSDLKQEPGSITADIIRDLAIADIVIADLTDSNPNVFFELGIRHVLRKSGTVHIAHAEAVLPFDVAQYRVVRYSTQLADLESSISDICNSVSRRIETPSQSDNPVHDTLAALPINYLATTSEALQSDLATMQNAIAKLQKEREELVHRLTQVGISADLSFDTSSSLDVDAILDEAEAATKQTGPYTLLRLANLEQEHNREGFVSTLREGLKSPYLDENDLSEIANRCVRLGLMEYQRAVLTLANRRFPRNQTFLLHLAQSYAQSPNVALKEQGKQILENLLNIIHTAGDKITMKSRPKISNAPYVVSHLTDIYQSLGKDEWNIQLCDEAIKVLGPDSLLLRNKARSMAEIGEIEQAEKTFKDAIELDSSDDTAVSFYASFLDDQGKYREAYEMYEKALLLDMDDPNRWLSLGIQVSNRKLIPKKNSNEFVRLVSDLEKRKFIVPIAIAAMNAGPKSEKTYNRIIGFLIRSEATYEASALASDQIPQGEYDTYLVDRILQIHASTAPNYLENSQDENEYVSSDRDE